MTARGCSEAEWQRTVVAAAKLNGWRVFWVPQWVWRVVFATWKRTGNRRGRDWPEAGLPDLLMVRPPRVVVAELKRKGGRVEPTQRAWLDDFAASGVEAYVWFPSDWDEVERVLRRDAA